MVPAPGRVWTTCRPPLKLRRDQPGEPDRMAEVDLLLELTSPEGRTMTLREILDVDAEGRLQLSYALQPGGNYRTLPKLGIQLGIDSACHEVEWWGNFYESYPDRRQPNGKATMPPRPTRCAESCT